MKSLEEQAEFLAGAVFHTILLDENWQLFGFRSRPKRGRVFVRFVSDSRLLVERFIFRELLLMNVGDIVAAIKQNAWATDKKLRMLMLFAAIVYSKLRNVDIFESSDTYLGYLTEGIPAYERSIGSLLIRTKTYIEKHDLENAWEEKLLRGVVNFSRQLDLGPDFEGFVQNRSLIASRIADTDFPARACFPLGPTLIDDYADFAERLLTP